MREKPGVQLRPPPPGWPARHPQRRKEWTVTPPTRPGRTPGWVRDPHHGGDERIEHIGLEGCTDLLRGPGRA
ncbi:hypothetical protein QJS66_15415 [Kocuria rhizophila]|nr:hypothetical protein QJS66_15415 [Kocuria rhizophila]